MKTTTHSGKPFWGLAQLLALFFILNPFALQAQYASPSIDASASSDAEYGTYDIDGQHSNESGGFYATWDANYLYVYLPNVNETHASIIYLDTYTGGAELLRPINSGSNADGNLTGYSYDNLGAVNLPMRADIVIYVKNNYREIRMADGAGSWALLSSGLNGLSGSGTDDALNGDLKIENNGNGASDDDRREFRIAWSHIGGLPNAFTWLAHIINPSTADVYKPSPANGNPVGNFHSTNITFPRYLQVASTANGASTPFYSRECYTHLATADVASFGVYTDVFDFTVNNGYRLTRDPCGGGNWRIVGSLVIGSGSIVDFGDHVFSSCAANYGTTKIEGSIDIYDNSSVIMNKTNQPADVDYNVQVFSATGSFSLSSETGGDVYIGNNFVNNGSFNSNNRAVFLDGSNSQLVEGTSPITINYLIINNTGAGVTFNREVEVVDELDLIDGIIYTSPTSKLVMKTTASMDATYSGSTESHINGPMDKVFEATSEFVYAVGKGGAYRPIAVTPTDATTTTFTAEYMNNPPSDSYAINSFASHPTKPLQNILNMEHWLIDRSGAADAKVKLFWHSGSGVSEPLDLRVAHWNGSAWENEGSEDLSGDTNSGSITSEIMEDFSPVAFGEVTTPAPIQLVAFHAEQTESRIQLHWSTAMEINNDYFVLEHSVDGIHFNAVGRLKGQGNSDQTHHYQWLHEEAYQGTNYYRIKDVAFDKSSSYSNIIQVDMKAGNGLGLAIIGDSQQKELQIAGQIEASIVLAIYDRQGRLVFGQKEDSLTSTIPLPQYLKGFHIIKVLIDGQQVIIKKVVL